MSQEFPLETDGNIAPRENRVTKYTQKNSISRQLTIIQRKMIKINKKRKTDL